MYLASIGAPRSDSQAVLGIIRRRLSGLGRRIGGEE
jgi:hypothetical protein